MTTTLQLRRGTAAEAAAFTGAPGELYVDIDNDIVYVHDGETQGGKGIGLDDTTNTVVSGVLNGNTITFTREDATTFTLDVTGLYDNVNTYVVSGLVSGSNLTLTMNDASTVTVDVSSLIDDTNLVTSVAGRQGAVTLTKSDVGLANVDNTSDADKPVSTATQLALDGKQNVDVNLVSDANYVHTDNNYTTAEKTKLSGVEDGATGDQTAVEIKIAYESNANTNVFADADKSKLNGIEAGATGDQTAVEIKIAYESNANTNAFTDIDKSKLAGIEEGATGDQSAAEIKASYESNANTNAFTDADKSKLAGIESGATGDQTKAEIDALGINASTVNGLTVETAVPAGAVFTDTVYTHPATHSVSEVSGLQDTLDAKVDNSRVLTDVPVGAVFTDTVYTHPVTHTIAEVSGLQGALDSKLATETVTTLTLVGNVLTYTDESGTPVAHDLSVYLDDTNLARLVSGTYDSQTQTLVFTRDDASTFSVDASMFIDDTNLVTSVAGRAGVVTLTKADVGLDNVDNTSDTNKPVSAATQTALDAKVDNSRVLTDVPVGAVFTDTVYTHPAEHAIGEVTGLQAALDGKSATTHDHNTSYQPLTANLVVDAAYVHTDNNFTSAYKTKVDGVEDGATGDMTKSEIDALGINALTVNGLTVETAVPVGAVFTDTVYTHPAEHAIGEVTGLQAALDDKVANARVLTDVPAGAVFTDTVYTHPAAHAISEVTGLQAALDSKLATETVTTLTLVGNVLTYTNENGTPVAHDLSVYLDDTNLARLVSGTYDSQAQTLVFTRDDASTFSVDASMFFDDTNLVTSVAGRAGVVTLTKADVGLDNVDNTTDAMKPVSTATQLALDGKVDNSRVLTDVPAGAVFTDTVYTHPATHTFAEVDGLQSALDGKVANARVLTDVPAGAVFTDTVYTHPATHAISEVSGLQAALDGKSATTHDHDTIYQPLTANLVVDASYVHTDNNFTDAYKVKVDGVEDGATADMTKAEIDALGINASTVNGLTVETAVPVGAVFTDTVYTHPATHTIAEVGGLQTELDGKASTAHVHVISDITDFAHNHAITDVTGLQAELDTKLTLSALPFDITSFKNGLPASNERLMVFVAVRSLTIPADLSGSYFVSGVATTAETILTIYQNGSSVGVITFPAADTVGVPDTSNTIITLSAGDVLVVTAPTTQDATFADFVGTIATTIA